jgi:hypothetical protein
MPWEWNPSAIGEDVMSRRVSRDLTNCLGENYKSLLRDLEVEDGV